MHVGKHRFEYFFLFFKKCFLLHGKMNSPLDRRLIPITTLLSFPIKLFAQLWVSAFIKGKIINTTKTIYGNNTKIVPSQSALVTH